MGPVHVVLPDAAASSRWRPGSRPAAARVSRGRSELGPEETIAELERAGLRGRGGAGFPIATKWRSVRRAAGRHRYAVCNGAEGEPGTFKDRAILRANPYQVVEGLAIAALGARRTRGVHRVEGELRPERERVMAAVTEMEQAGLVGDLSIGIVAGPEEYLFGEEKALLEVIEGNDPLPRWLPPYVHGLFATAPQLGWQAHEPEAGHSRGHESNPTSVNNVETLANVAHVLAKGADWYRSFGTSESPGTVVCTVVGDAERAGVVEVECGTPLREVLTMFGAPRPGRAIRAVLPGVTNAVLTEAQLDTPLAFETFAADRAAGWARRVSSSTTTPRAWSTSRLCSRGSCTSSRAGSAHRASSVPARSRARSTTSLRDAAPTRASRASTTGSRSSPTAIAASSRSKSSS